MTHDDETLTQRYQREHETHLASLAAMTPEQIFALEVEAHNAMAEVDKLKARIVEIESGAESLRLTSDYHKRQADQYRKEWAGRLAAATVGEEVERYAFEPYGMQWMKDGAYVLHDQHQRLIEAERQRRWDGNEISSREQREEVQRLQAEIERLQAYDSFADLIGWTVKVEKALCEKLGKPWTPDGISIQLLIDELGVSLEEAKHGQRVLAHELETMTAHADNYSRMFEEEHESHEATKAEVERLTTACNKFSEPEMLAQTVVLPEPIDDRSCSIAYASGWSACLDEVARLNGAKP
jgi:hypothetical protein